MSKLLDSVQQILIQAGSEILKHYGNNASNQVKADQSPLTLADLDSHHFILKSLQDLTPDIPVISEESAETVPYETRRTWSRFWLVDPLDGTKEFVKQTGQFTVNIALIENQEAVLGGVYVPVTQLLYLAEKGSLPIKKDSNQNAQTIQARTPDLENLSFVASRDHAGPQVKELLERFPKATTQSMGSSLKFCLVAEGKADLYLRDVPTMEWDTAAAQCIVEAAGGRVEDLEGKRLMYNKEILRNPFIITLGKGHFNWK